MLLKPPPLPKLLHINPIIWMHINPISLPCVNLVERKGDKDRIDIYILPCKLGRNLSVLWAWEIQLKCQKKKKRKKRNSTSKMELLVLSPMSANQDIILNLIATLTSPRNGTFNQSIWNYLVSITEVICVKALCLSPKEVTSPETIHALLE